MSKKEIKNKKETKKKNTKKKKESFFKGVINELKKVKWPDKKSMIKYTSVTILFIVFLGVYFYLITILTALIRTVVS